MQSCIELFEGNVYSANQQAFETSATSFVRPDFRRQRTESLRQLVSKDGPYVISLHLLILFIVFSNSALERYQTIPLA